MSELGPFYPAPDGQSLMANPYTWANNASVVFLESPAGVGFSYSNTSSDYTTGDARTADDVYAFLVGFYQRHADLASRPLWISGESYGGHYVPTVAAKIADRHADPKYAVARGAALLAARSQRAEPGAGSGAHGLDQRAFGSLVERRARIHVRFVLRAADDVGERLVVAVLARLVPLHPRRRRVEQAEERDVPARPDLVLVPERAARPAGLHPLDVRSVGGLVQMIAALTIERLPRAPALVGAAAGADEVELGQEIGPPGFGFLGEVGQDDGVEVRLPVRADPQERRALGRAQPLVRVAGVVAGVDGGEVQPADEPGRVRAVDDRAHAASFVADPPRARIAILDFG